jgi:hypothetical protein
MCCKVDFLKRHTICLNELRNVVLPVLTYARVKSVINIVPTEWVALLTRIRELWASEHCSKTDYPERVFLVVLFCASGQFRDTASNSGTSTPLRIFVV